MRKSSGPQWAIRVLLYIIGLLFLAFGVAISANSNLGISPVNSLPYVFSDIVKVKPGTCVTVVFCIYILLQAIILRKDFKIVNLFQIVFSTIFGYFVNFSKAVVGDFMIPGGIAGRLLMQVISIILVAFGVFIYMEVELVPMPMEGLTAAIAQKVGKPFHSIKTIVDCGVVLLGIILTVVFLHIIPFVDSASRIGIGTVLAAVVTGKLVGMIKKPLTASVKKICFGEEK